MSIIDYRKWDNILADIEKQEGIEDEKNDYSPKDEDFPLERAPQSPASKNNSCECVRVFSKSNRPGQITTQGHFFESITVPKHHPMQVSGTALVSPVSKKIGAPLIIYLEDPLQHPLFRPDIRSNYENQFITYLLIKPSDGFAPIQYQDGIGTALVARADHHPLTIGFLTTVHAYVSMLLQKRYGNGDDSQVQYSITPNDFKKFAHKFVTKTKKGFNKDWNFEY